MNDRAISDCHRISHSSRRKPVEYIIEGHELGWVPAERSSEEVRQKIELLLEASGKAHEPEMNRSYDEVLEQLEGDLVPTCTCGWCGYTEPWTNPLTTSRSGGQQHSAHKHWAQLNRINQQLSAHAAAAALRHAADAWTGRDPVARWLDARADHIEEIGLYDAERWP